MRSIHRVLLIGAALLLCCVIVGCKRQSKAGEKLSPWVAGSSPGMATTTDLLRGQKTMAIAIHLDAPEGVGLSESSFKGTLQTGVRSFGIVVAPATPETPILQGWIEAVSWKNDADERYLVYSLTLNYDRLLPIVTAGGETKTTPATIWTRDTYGTRHIDAGLEDGIVSDFDKLVGVFVEDYKEANH